MLNKLTPQQEALVTDVRDEWLAFVFKSKHQASRQTIRKYVRWLYDFSELKKPIVVILDSPMACQIAANVLVWNQVENQVGNQVRSQVWKQVENQVGNQVWNQVENQVRNQVGNQVRSQVWNQVGNQVWNQVGNQVRNQVGNLKYFTPAWRDGLNDSSWVSFYDYFHRIGIVKHEAFKVFTAYLKTGVFYSIFFDGLAIVCGRPAHIKRDNQQRLHCDGGPAILWPDGYSQYFSHGVDMPAQYILTPAEQLDPKLVLTEKNVDVRRELIRKIGPERVLVETGAKELDDWNDPQAGLRYRLMEMSIGGGIQRKYLYFEHASMPGVFYAKPVPRECTKALQARAWILGMIEREQISAANDSEIIANLPAHVS